MVDPIVVEEIESDDEWITEIEDPVLPTNLDWLEEELEEQLFNVEAVRNVPLGTYQNTLHNRESIPHEPTSSPPREPTPPPPSRRREPTPHPPPPRREPTLALDEPIVSYKRKYSGHPSSSKRKAPRKSMLLNDIEENETIRTNPHDDLNPLFEHHDDLNPLFEHHDDLNPLFEHHDDSSDDSLDGDLLLDEDDEFGV